MSSKLILRQFMKQTQLRCEINMATWQGVAPARTLVEA
jgi:hypothetical protein